MSTPAVPRKNELQRKLGVWSAVAVVIGSTIGSGIFRSPAGIANRLPGPLPMMAVWVAGGMFALCGALTMAEVASALPATGGIYVFCRDAWGRLAGFLFGWGQISMIRAASLGGIAITFAEYFFRVLGFDPLAPSHVRIVHWTAAGAIALTGAFNYVGVRRAAASRARPVARRVAVRAPASLSYGAVAGGVGAGAVVSGPAQGGKEDKG